MNKRICRFFLILCWIGLVVAIPSSLAAQGSPVPDKLPAADFARIPARAGLSFSPDGKHFAIIAEYKGRQALDVIDFAQMQGKSYFGGSDADVVGFRWLTSDLIQLRTGKVGTRLSDLWYGNYALLYLSISGKSLDYMPGGVRPFRNVPGSDTDLIVDNDGRLDIIDSITGSTKARLRANVPGAGKLGWVIDKSMSLRATYGWSHSRRKTEIWWRDSAEGPWRQIYEFDPETERGYYPVAMDSEGHLLVLSNLATGYFALYRFDPVTNMPGELLAGQVGADIYSEDLVYSRDKIDPIGVRIQGDFPHTYWFDDARENVQRTVDVSLPKGNVNILQFLADGKALVRSYGPADPGTYYFYDSAKKSLSQWERVEPWIVPAQMGVTSVLHYKARDGVDIPAYLTLPRGHSTRDLPLMIWVHGGPHSRDEWEFDPFVQFFANRGYAVLQVNFRGSTGFGRDFETAGYKQRGRAMQDDLTDGVRALVAKGTVDPRRVCIGGASYGGYAALMGLIKEPDLFRCAIDYAGPSDLVWTVDLPETDYNWHFDADTDRVLKNTVGDPSDPQDRRLLEENSPRLHADKIRSPVLMVYGTDDRRVPFRHGTAMRDALKAAGGTFEWKQYSGEGHGIQGVANTVDLMKTIDAFLARYNGADIDALSVKNSE